jgi:hypothetical protein
MYISNCILNREADFWGELRAKIILKFGLKMKKEENLKPNLFFKI